MGLSDRAYMKKDPMSPSLTSPSTLTTKLTIFYASVYFIDRILEYRLSDNLAYSTQAIRNLELWRLITAFAIPLPREGVFTVFISLLIFWLIGRNIEQVLGKKPLLNLLICTSIGMGLVGLISPVIAMGYYEGFLSSLFLTLGLFLGRQKITIKLYFIIPVSLSGYTLIIFTIGLVFLSAFLGSSANAIAVLGGCFAGYFYINQYKKGNIIDFFSYIKRLFPKSKSKPKKANENQRNFQLINNEDYDSNSTIDTDKFIEEQVDPILEKIATSGMSSLTKEEKKILEQAKKKLKE